MGPVAVAPAPLQGLQPTLPHLSSAQQRQEWLGWQPLELAGIPQSQLQQRLAELLQGCPGLDHSVPSVSHLPGGSNAGYAWWEQFRKWVPLPACLSACLHAGYLLLQCAWCPLAMASSAAC